MEIRNLREIYESPYNHETMQKIQPIIGGTLEVPMNNGDLVGDVRGFIRNLIGGILEDDARCWRNIIQQKTGCERLDLCQPNHPFIPGK